MSAKAAAQFFLKRQLRVRKTHFLRHLLRENCFERGQRLAGGVAGRGRALDLDRAQQIKSGGELGAGNVFNRDQRRQRNHLVRRF